MGRIKDAGLSSPTERIAYVRPPDILIDRDRMLAITGFGDQGQLFGDELFIDPLSQFFFAIIALMVFPACVLVLVAARMGGEARDRRTALLSALGAGRGARALIDLGEAVVPVLVGVTGGVGLLAVLVETQTALPFVDFPLPAADARSAAGEVLAAAAGSAAAVLTSVVVLHRHLRQRGRRGAGTRPQLLRRTPGWWPAMLPVSLIVATRGPELLAPRNPFLFIVVYMVGMLLTLATLPSAISLLMAAAGRLLSRLARQYGGTGTLVAGRWLTERPGVTARLVAGAVVAIGLIGQVQLHSSRISEPMIAAQATAARIGTSVLTVQVPHDTSHITSFLQALPAGTQAFSLQLTSGSGQTAGTAVLQAPCAQIRETIHRVCVDGGQTLQLTDPDRRLKELVGWYGQQGSISLREGPVPAPPTENGSTLLVVMSPGGGNLDVPSLIMTARQHLSPNPAIQPPGGEWLTGALLKKTRVPWVTLFGSCALIFIGLAIGLNSTAEFIRFSRSIAPLGVLTGRRRLFATVAAWTLLVPLLLAAGLGLVAHIWLASPLTTPLIGAQLSWSVIGWLLALVVLLATGSWMGGTWSAQRAAARWIPDGD
ncbi:hypothetical protein [Kitasatospora sp. NPDC057223]|uniref:hypothetical protein n=1 Tax=Kitasatospora sp. NPDC057223 TaxID=3346055 RepID=UPI00363FD549